MPEPLAAAMLIFPVATEAVAGETLLLLFREGKCQKGREDEIVEPALELES
jgi:hypothetical protein